ncbi:MAG: flagellar hook-associated protein 2, partial [Thermoleophilaceae bacterium]|nr:flagellar hook-associated protein 2 [Thermoleophilaceae bacterium]
DQTAFTTALNSDPSSVRKLLGGDSAVSGFAQSFDNLLKPMVQAQGTLDQAISGQDAQRRQISDDLTRMDALLAKKQAFLKSQFTAMEKAMQTSQSQGQWLTGQLNALNKSG